MFAMSDDSVVFAIAMTWLSLTVTIFESASRCVTDRHSLSWKTCWCLLIISRACLFIPTSEIFFSKRWVYALNVLLDLDCMSRDGIG